MEIIAEIGINANGDTDIARDLIRMARESGADWVKFQKRNVDIVYSADDLAKPRESPWGTTQGEQKHGLEFSTDEYAEINNFCKATGIKWFASAWDLDSLLFLEQFDVERHKIASTMITNLEFVEQVAMLRKPTLISTGASTWEDIDRAVEIFDRHHCPFTLMHCVMEYPCPVERCNVQMVTELRNRYPGTVIGYSGHEVGLTPSVVAAALGAQVIERHITLDRSMYGSDQSASLERRGLELLVKYCHEVEPCLGDGVKEITPNEADNAAKMRYWL